MPILTERKLVFEFSDAWQVVAYDRPADPATGAPASFYRRIVEKGGVQQVCGMDVVCRLPNVPEKLQFIEIKDDRKREMAAGPRHTELFRIVMQKTAGTLAGLVLAERLAEDTLQPYACLSRAPEIEVILFLLEPDLLPEAADDTENNLLRLAQKQRLSGLDQKLTAKLGEWGLQFNLYNRTPDRLPVDWEVSEVSPDPT
jgi:hypothetical protein